jgi:hypothetical protein
MPYRIENRGGKRPFKIINKNTGKTVGSSKTMGEAKASVRARYAGEGKRNK